MGKLSSNKLTVRYSLYQMCFFTTNAGIFAFAAAYLLDKGFQTSQTGTILAATNIISCVFQPVLGDFADRFRGFVFPKIIAALLLCSLGSFLFIQIFHPAIALYGFLYVIGGLAVSVTVSLNNSLCAYYSRRNIPINFGIGAGVGSLSYSFASLGIGYVIARMGADWMIWIVLASLVFQIVLVIGYPQINQDGGREQTVDDGKQEESVSIIRFWRKYPYFTITILGAMLLAMCHSMTENYLIHIFSRIGGGSLNVGTALFIACISAAPVLLFIEKIQNKTGFSILMRLSGVFYICKAFLLIEASTVLSVYLIELLQFCTYGFIYPLLYYFAKERMMDADMAKGQAVSMSFYTLGTAFGSYAGGILIDAFGVEKMLFTALLPALAGTVIINMTVGKTDNIN